MSLVKCYLLTNVSYLEISEVVLVHCNIVNNNYQQHSKVLYAFVPNKSFGQLLDILYQNFVLSKKFVSFTDQNSKPLELEDKIIIPLVIN